MRKIKHSQKLSLSIFCPKRRSEKCKRSYKILFSKSFNTAAQVQEHVLNNTWMSIRSKATNLQGKNLPCKSQSPNTTSLPINTPISEKILMSNLWKMCCKMSWRFARLRTPKVKLRSFYKQKITLSSGISSDFLTNSRKFWEISGHCLQHLKNDSDLFCGTDFRVSRILFTGFMQQSWNFNSRMTNLEVPLIMFFLSECSANSIIYRDFTEIWDSFIARQSSLL